MSFVKKHPKIFYSIIIVWGAIVLLPFLYIGGLYAISVVEEIANRVPFNSDVWKDTTQTYFNNQIRIKMVDDLLIKYKLVGMDRTEVEELLGKRDDTPYFEDWDYIYWLGDERGFISIDSEWLGLKIDDATGKVKEARIVRD